MHGDQNLTCVCNEREASSAAVDCRLLCNGANTTPKGSSIVNTNLYNSSEMAHVTKLLRPFMRSQVWLIGVTVLI